MRMLSVEYAFVFMFTLAVLPFSLAQMKVSLDQKDTEGFYLWLCIACLVSGLPFRIATFLEPA